MKKLLNPLEQFETTYIKNIIFEQFEINISLFFFPFLLISLFLYFFNL